MPQKPNLLAIVSALAAFTPSVGLVRANAPQEGSHRPHGQLPAPLRGAR